MVCTAGVFFLQAAPNLSAKNYLRHTHCHNGQLSSSYSRASTLLLSMSAGERQIVAEVLWNML
jgi:hypothetical protein